MATIEPRLMHLSTVLNTQQADSPSTVQLGPITTPANNNSLFLPTLSRDAGQQQHQQQQQRVDKQLPTLPPIHTLSNESLTKQTPRIDPFGSESAARHPSSSHSLQLLLSNSPESSSTPLSLRRPAPDHPDAFQDAANKKRQRVLAAKDDYVQLPQPLKKQKSTQEVVLQQQHLVTVPPILNGLHEPPPNPNTSRFPPILSGVVDHEPPRISGYMHDLSPPAHIPASTTTTPPAEWPITSPPPTDGDKTSGGKAKRRAAKPRRKWSDEETNNLLLGVSRHGVGKWTTILEDPDYKFNDRTAGDLKDRFRTCCPEELRGGSSKRSPGADKSTSGESSTPTTSSRHKNGLSLDALLSNPETGPIDRDRGDSDSAPAKQRKSRAHRKKMEDLVELGIRGPFKKSHRRERRPFTDVDDKEILAGLKKHGPAWTKIQRDPEYHLQSRQPTDLRDRVRNKYPAIYASIEKTNPRDKDQQARGSAEATAASSSSLFEPSANPPMSKTMEPTIARSIEQQVSRQSSREELPKWLPSTTCEPTGTLPGLASVFGDLPDGPLSSSYFAQPPDMDISRLLLNDGHDPSASERLRYGQGGMGGSGPVHPGGQDGSSSGPAHRRGH